MNAVVSLPWAVPPQAPILSSHSRLLVVAPHPDDETIATGVLIQQALAAGAAVRVLSMTGGDNNPWPQRWLEKRLRIGAADRARWAQRRQRELHRALEQLGLPAESLRVLGWPDQGVTRRLQDAFAASLAAMRQCLSEFNPTVVAMPSLYDGHPDHGATHVLVRLALQGRRPMPQQVAYLIHGCDPAPGREAHWVASVQARAGKSLALEHHTSQLALSGGRMRRFARRPERYAWLETDFPRAAATCDGVTAGRMLPWRPPVLLRPWLRLTVLSASGVRVWRWSEAPLKRAERGHWLVQLPPGMAGPCFVRLESTLPSLWIFDRWGWRELV